MKLHNHETFTPDPRWQEDVDGDFWLERAPVYGWAFRKPGSWVGRVDVQYVLADGTEYELNRDLGGNARLGETLKEAEAVVSAIYAAFGKDGGK